LAEQIDIYFEASKKRTFAGAIDWPGWCRRGHDEESALEALFDYGPRYANVLRAGNVDFAPPTNPAVFTVVERLEGNATTDFGSPGQAPSADERPVDEAGRARFEQILKACWLSLDDAISAAKGHELRKGPRGGGRDLDQMIGHVLEADGNYLAKLAWKYKVDEGADFGTRLAITRQTILDTLAASVRGELPVEGPRGGKLWSPRYFVRRVAWHALDHAWEIEDRIE
jgi:hypothetical protein